jgi:hypothetical protein
LTVVVLFARAAFGIALATTPTLGVVVALLTVGVSQLGHVPVATLVTPAVPLPLPAGQFVPFCKQGRIPPIVVPAAKALAESVAATDGAVIGPPNEYVPVAGLNPSLPPPDRSSSKM